MTSCTVGCVLRGEHRSTCDGSCHGCLTWSAEHRVTCNGSCSGCLPRPVDVGELCAWCWLRLRWDLAEIPGLVDHLHQLAEAMVNCSEVRSNGDPAERTVLHPAWLDADDLLSLVTSWARLVLEEYPGALAGPNSAPWHGDVVAWLAPRLEWCAAQEWAPEMRRELATEVSKLKGRWPTPDMVEAERYIPGVQCPRCDQASLTYTPPSLYRQPFQVVCQNADCARVFSEGEWTRLVALLERTERRR